MVIKIHFDSYIMEGDSVTFEADTIEEIRQMFSEWLESRGMDKDITKHNSWSEEIK